MMDVVFDGIMRYVKSRVTGDFETDIRFLVQELPPEMHAIMMQRLTKMKLVLP